MVFPAFRSILGVGGGDDRVSCPVPSDDSHAPMDVKAILYAGAQYLMSFSVSVTSDPIYLLSARDGGLHRQGGGQPSPDQRSLRLLKKNVIAITFEASSFKLCPTISLQFRSACIFPNNHLV